MRPLRYRCAAWRRLARNRRSYRSEVGVSSSAIFSVVASFKAPLSMTLKVGPGKVIRFHRLAKHIPVNRFRDPFLAAEFNSPSRRELKIEWTVVAASEVNGTLPGVVLGVRIRSPRESAEG